MRSLIRDTPSLTRALAPYFAQPVEEMFDADD